MHPPAWVLAAQLETQQTDCPATCFPPVAEKHSPNRGNLNATCFPPVAEKHSPNRGNLNFQYDEYKHQVVDRTASETRVEESRLQEDVPAWVLAAQFAKQQNDCRNHCDGSMGCSGWQLLWQWIRKSRLFSKGEIEDKPNNSAIPHASSSLQHIPNSVDAEQIESRPVKAQTSRSTMMRHISEAPWLPTLCLYDASMDAQTGLGVKGSQRAYHIPLNGNRPCSIDNNNFTGTFIMLHRTPDDEGLSSVSIASPYDAHFRGKSRRWEVRVQGKFKKPPAGMLHTGCILRDFDYTHEQSWSVSALAALVVPLMEAVMGQAFYFSWGTRGVNIDPAEQELATMVTSLAGVDQIIVTPAGEQPPSLQSNITGMGFCRNAMSRDDFRTVAQHTSTNANTEDTYTFCVWGCSPNIDCTRSRITSAYLGSLSYEGFLDEWPAHFVLYSLPFDGNDPRHLESNKTYYIDIMVWGSEMAVPQLPERYDFFDSRMQP